MTGGELQHCPCPGGRSTRIRAVCYKLVAGIYGRPKMVIMVQPKRHWRLALPPRVRGREVESMETSVTPAGLGKFAANRREFLRLSGLVGIAAGGTATLGGCGLFGEEPA